MQVTAQCLRELHVLTHSRFCVKTTSAASLWRSPTSWRNAANAWLSRDVIITRWRNNKRIITIFSNGLPSISAQFTFYCFYLPPFTALFASFKNLHWIHTMPTQGRPSNHMSEHIPGQISELDRPAYTCEKIYARHKRGFSQSISTSVHKMLSLSSVSVSYKVFLGTNVKVLSQLLSEGLLDVVVWAKFCAADGLKPNCGPQFIWVRLLFL